MAIFLTLIFLLKTTWIFIFKFWWDRQNFTVTICNILFVVMEALQYHTVLFTKQWQLQEHLRCSSLQLLRRKQISKTGVAKFLSRWPLTFLKISVSVLLAHPLFSLWDTEVFQFLGICFQRVTFSRVEFVSGTQSLLLKALVWASSV